MTVLKTKVNGLWTEIAGDVSPIAQVPQNVLDFVTYWTPTAWVAFTKVNSWATPAGQQNFSYRKIGDLVYLRGSIHLGVAQNVCTIPVGYRPPTTLFTPASLWGLPSLGCVLEASNGNIDIIGNTTWPANIFGISVTYSVTA